MKLNLLVIRSYHPEKLASFYELLDISFEYHKHGNGPMHYAAELEDFVFEIYPLLKNQDTADVSTRLGFRVENLDDVLFRLCGEDIEIVKDATQNEFGYQAIVKDPDGRKIELTEKDTICN